MLRGSISGRFTFDELSDNTERRGDGTGDGDGEKDRCGVGGWDAVESVHVREHMAHVVEKHLGYKSVQVL